MKIFIALLSLFCLSLFSVAGRTRPHPSRYQECYIFPKLPATKLDTNNANIGVAQQLANDKKLQARIFWIDGTANLDKISSAEKIKTLIEKIKLTGFNTIVF
jgi:uridylate kinase